MKHARHISLALLAAMLATTLSCGGESVSTETTTTAHTDTTTAPVETAVSDDLPDENFEGYNFRILSSIRGSATLNAFPEEQSGDTMNDAYWKRNDKIAARFNVEFTEDTTGDGLSIEFLQRDVLAGDDVYDLYQVWDRIAFAAAREGYIESVDKLDAINLDKPYWSDFNERLTIGDKLYFVTGDENPVLLTGMVALTFNKDMCDELGIGRTTFYDDVRNGQWTVDKFYGYAKQAIRDVDGDGKMTESDTYGITMNNNVMWVDFFTNSKLYLIDKDGDGMPYISAAGNERFADLYEKLYQLSYTDDGMLFSTSKNTLSNAGSSDSLVQTYIHFGNGHSLFASNTLSRAGALREFDLDYGIVPIPTLDEKEAGEPYSGRTDSLVPYVVPITNTDLHRTSVILEALACEGHKSVVPTYYDVVLGQKETRDEDSVEMLEMMFANRCIELETVMLASRFIEGQLGNRNPNFTSSLAARTPELESKLTALIEAE